MSKTSHFRKIWSMPLLLAVLSLVGLLSALLGEQLAWKALAWITLAVPIVVGLWYACLRQRAKVRKMFSSASRFIQDS
ncbi:hypothetical protein [Rhodanobacter sp. C01]|uniref:hypothetical protein n=1 Tax=Rhodanobacter sp. C01 TaxID=1945856 RepID=UPI000984A988|nr:hypothetical protein [Rhodanobacter sp. C01]OOG48715.1 hypothetical protein B0E50_09065 [Rhodanobacter sp. C01]